MQELGMGQLEPSFGQHLFMNFIYSGHFFASNLHIFQSFLHLEACFSAQKWLS